MNFNSKIQTLINHVNPKKLRGTAKQMPITANNINREQLCQNITCKDRYLSQTRTVRSYLQESSINRKIQKDSNRKTKSKPNIKLILGVSQFSFPENVKRK
jgi:hypothetical protein